MSSLTTVRCVLRDNKGIVAIAALYVAFAIGLLTSPEWVPFEVGLGDGVVIVLVAFGVHAVLTAAMTNAVLKNLVLLAMVAENRSQANIVVTAIGAGLSLAGIGYIAFLVS